MAKRFKIKGRTPPSSTRKKLAKEGNPRLIGPRQSPDTGDARRDAAWLGHSKGPRIRKKVRVPNVLKRIREKQDEVNKNTEAEFGVKGGPLSPQLPEFGGVNRGITKNKRLKELLEQLDRKQPWWKKRGEIFSDLREFLILGDWRDRRSAQRF